MLGRVQLDWCHKAEHYYKLNTKLCEKHDSIVKQEKKRPLFDVNYILFMKIKGYMNPNESISRVTNNWDTHSSIFKQSFPFPHIDVSKMKRFLASTERASQQIFKSQQKQRSCSFFPCTALMKVSLCIEIAPSKYA